MLLGSSGIGFTMIKFFAVYLTVVIGLSCCGLGNKVIIYNEPPKTTPSLEIGEGLVSLTAQHIYYNQAGKNVAEILLSKPVMVSQAEREESWGYYQFPSIGKTEDDVLIVEWQMQDDSYDKYGSTSSSKYSPMMSKDGGITWTPLDNNYIIYRRGNNVYLKNGGYLQVKSQPARNINNYNFFPKAVYKEGTYTFYPIENLPSDLQGVYIYRRDKNNKAGIIHAKLYDPGALRYSIDGKMPIVWWGNIRQLADSSLVAGIYPSYYLDSNGDLLKGGISFYHSTDYGFSWEIIGRIPFQSKSNNLIRENDGFAEPAFEILPDSTFFCVMRSGSASPLYKSFSKDRGRTWSPAEPFTPNGVKPQLLLLNNGVLVLSTGRPGVQVRFSFDGKGQQWSDPIDFVPFMNQDRSYTRDVSCGYTSLIAAGDDSFYIVWSNFTTKDSYENNRKSIWCRKVTVITR